MARTDKLSNYRTTVWLSSGGNAGTVTYVRTQIVDWTEDTIALRTGGWKSVTTKRKMNQAARQFGLGYGVHQRKGEWYVSRWDARTSTWVDEKPFDGDTYVFARSQGRTLGNMEDRTRCCAP